MDGHQGNIIGVLDVVVGVVSFGFQISAQRDVGQEIDEFDFATFFNGSQCKRLNG